jgi:hypothetical protein
MDTNILIEKIKKARLQRFDTNCYNADVIGRADNIFEIGDSFVFSYEDHGINRLCYFAAGFDTLNELLNSMEPGPYYIDIMTREPDDVRLSGAECEARMKRLANNDCNTAFENEEITRYRNDSIVKLADVSDTKEINELLWRTFRTEVSHLLTDDELADVIQKGNVTIHKNEEIDAVLQVEVMPRKFYINQVINRSGKEVIHSMMLSRLDQYRKNGGKYIYSWVDEANIASLRFHKKYGMEHDGMWNLVYCLK